MFRRFFLLATIIISSFLVSIPAFAQSVNGTSNIPELNPFCWKKKDCLEVRKSYELGSPSKEDLESGFVSNASVAPCNGGTGDDQWGRCLPAGTTKTQISFGGQDRFASIGEFILVMYKYLVGTASIIATVMIVIAGVQWVTSGGNSETISSAKNRIGGALIGLLIAFLSYFILNTVNPALVNFRLPQVWLVRPQSLIPQFCNQVPGATSGTTKFYFYSGDSDQKSSVDFNKADREHPVIYGQNDSVGFPVFSCGRRFLVENGGTQACFGNVCANSVPRDRYMCNKLGLQSDAQYGCSKGELSIHYFIDYRNDLSEQLSLAGEKLFAGLGGLVISGSLRTSWLAPNQGFWGVCDAGAGQQVYISKDTQRKYPLRYYLANNGREVRWNDNTNGVSILANEKVGEYHEYIISFSKLADPENGVWNCNQGGELVGYLLRNETVAKDSFFAELKDFVSLNGIHQYPNLTIGYDQARGTAVFGTMSGDVGNGSMSNFSNFIPISKLKDGGLHLEVGVTIGKYVRMSKLSKENPGSFYSNIDKLNTIDAALELVSSSRNN